MLLNLSFLTAACLGQIQQWGAKAGRREVEANVLAQQGKTEDLLPAAIKNTVPVGYASSGERVSHVRSAGGEVRANL